MGSGSREWGDKGDEGEELITNAQCPMPNPLITLLSFTLYLFDFSEI